MFDIVNFLSSIVYTMAEGCRIYILWRKNVVYTKGVKQPLRHRSYDIETLVKACRIYDSSIVISSSCSSNIYVFGKDMWYIRQRNSNPH